MTAAELADIRKRLAAHGKPARKPAATPEHDEQVALFKWAQVAAKVRPALHNLFAVPNGGKRSKATAGRMKAEGQKSGVPDLSLQWPSAGYHGLWIEMKAGKNSTSDEQSGWLTRLLAAGYACYVAYSWVAARDLILAYLDGTPKDGLVHR